MRIPIIALVTLTPALAFAQVVPQIQLVPLDNETLRLEPEEFQNLDLLDQAPIMFQFTLAGGEPDNDRYNFEVVYGDPSTTSSTARQVVLDNNDFNRRVLTDERITVGETIFFSMRPSQILLPDLEDAEAGRIEPGLIEDTRAITVHVFEPGGQSQEDRSDSARWSFSFDLSPPNTPTIDSVQAKENGLTVRWSAPSNDADVEFYEVHYCRMVDSNMVSTTSTNAENGVFFGENLPCSGEDVKVIDGIGRTVFDETIRDLDNGENVAVAVRAVDAFLNIGEFSDVLLQTPRPVTDFFEHYKAAGGSEDGGFCFVATAAYGSYGHPMVRVLRWFRDVILDSSPAGRALILAYYEASPPAADYIAQRPGLRAAAKVALIPFVLIAMIALLSPLLGLGALLWLFRRRIRPRHAAASGLALLMMLSAQADANPRPKPEIPVGFGFEFRGGPYRPDMSNAPRLQDVGNQNSYELIFGQDLNPLFSLALDIQIYRGFGTAGVGGSFGFMQFVGRARRLGTDIAADETTVFNILPLTLTAFYRFDWLADNSPIPIVPYVRGGLAYYVWWVTQGVGNVSRFDNNNQDITDDVAGRGGKFGITGSIGLAFMLNVLEPQSAQSLFATTGIRGTYIFAELQGNKVDGFGGDGFDLSDATWNLGFYLEL